MIKINRITNFALMTFFFTIDNEPEKTWVHYILMDAAFIALSEKDRYPYKCEISMRLLDFISRS